MTAANSNRRHTLIVIDSEPPTRSNVKRWMGEQGVRVIGEADNTKVGLRLVRGLQPDVVLLELPAGASQTMEVIKRMREELPDTRIILSSHETSPQMILTCIRAGAHEFVARPIEQGELDKAFDHIRKLLERTFTTRRRRGKVLSVFSTKGGIGATSFVANLGVALAAHPDTKIVLVDLSFQMGDLGLLLDQPTRYSLTDALDEGVIDEAKLRTTLSQHSSGVHVLTVAASPENGEEITRDHMVELFGTLNTMFDYVVVDVGRHLDDRTVEVLELSKAILIMSTLDLPTIRNVSRYLNIFDRLKLERERMHLIINRFHKKSRLSLKDLETTVGLDVFWTIPNDFQPMSLGIDGGTPAVIEAPRSKVARSFIDLAGCLCDLYEEESSLGPIMTGTS